MVRPKTLTRGSTDGRGVKVSGGGAYGKDEGQVVEAHRAKAVTTEGQRGTTATQAEYLLLLSLAELSK